MKSILVSVGLIKITVFKIGISLRENDIGPKP